MGGFWFERYGHGTVLGFRVSGSGFAVGFKIPGFRVLGFGVESLGLGFGG